MDLPQGAWAGKRRFSGGAGPPLATRMNDMKTIYRNILFGTAALILLYAAIPFSVQAAETGMAQSSPGTEAQGGAPASEGDEWGEPDVEKPQTGRDEDARRRLMEIETWRRKMEAEKAGEEQEQADKVKFEFSGKFKVRLNIRDNLHLDNPGQFWEYDESTYLDERFQLKIDAIYGPFSMVMLFDQGNVPYGWNWKEDSEGTLGKWSEFDTSLPPLVRELYFQYTGAFVLKVGKHNYFVGNGGIVMEGPVDSIKLMYPAGQTFLGRMTLSFAYISMGGAFKEYTEFRQTGGPPSGARNALIGISNKLDGLLFSVETKHGKSLTIEPYALKLFDRGGAGDPDLNLDKDFDLTTMSRDGEFEPLWLGAAISGKGKRISYSADLIYLTGPYSKNRNLNAYAAMVRADYHFERKGFSTGLESGMGSGNKADDTEEDDYKDFSGLWLCKDRRKFGNIFSEDLRAGYFLWGSSLANVTFARAIVELEPFEKIKTALSVVKLWTTESVYKGHGPVGDWSNGASSSMEETRDIGWEADLNVDFSLYKRLNGFIEAGYFVPGDVYQTPDGRQADPASEIVIGAEFVF